MSSDFIFLKACRREKTERTPVWIMRQAGRYLPEYRAIRKKTDFLTLCKTPELAAEITVQPVDVIGVDAAILFSDILVIPEAMGMKLDVIESKGPVFDKPVRSINDIGKLNYESMIENLTYVMDAIKVTKEKLNGCVPLIGFSGASWTLATYMVEGKGSKSFDVIKSFIYNEPEAAHKLLNILSNCVIEYLNEMIRAGCDAVQIFDTWAGILSPGDFDEFSFQYLKKIVAGISHTNIPIIVFAKGIHDVVKIAELGCDVVSIDWTMDIGKVKEKIGDRVAIQGNLDPCVLFASKEKIKYEVDVILKKFGNNEGHIFNLGHGILPNTPVENVKYFVNYVKEESKKYH